MFSLDSVPGQFSWTFPRQFLRDVFPGTLMAEPKELKFSAIHISDHLVLHIFPNVLPGRFS